MSARSGSSNLGYVLMFSVSCAVIADTRCQLYIGHISWILDIRCYAGIMQREHQETPCTYLRGACAVPLGLLLACTTVSLLCLSPRGKTALDIHPSRSSHNQRMRSSKKAWDQQADWKPSFRDDRVWGSHLNDRKSESSCNPVEFTNDLPQLGWEHNPNHTSWKNSIGICATMFQENMTDVREWLIYHRCGASVPHYVRNDLGAYVSSGDLHTPDYRSLRTLPMDEWIR